MRAGTEVFLSGFAGAACLMAVVLVATWPNQPRNRTMLAPQPTAGQQYAAAHPDLAPEEKPFRRWADEQRPFPMSPLGQPPSPRSLVYLANKDGDFVLNLDVNGIPTKFLVDTGATSVALSLTDALAAGMNRNELVFEARAETANGLARAAPVRLREIRLGGFLVRDLPAVVIEGLDVSLLGMGVLRRFQSFEMRSGKVTITW
jgi:clan AA aspartic protease (TIGR02281 family)